MSIHNQPIYTSDQYDLLIHDLNEAGIDAVSVTNGSFNSLAEEIVRQTKHTLAAGFQYIHETSPIRLRQAFIVAVHGTKGMVKDYGVDPKIIIPDAQRAETFLPFLRDHFGAHDIPVAAVVFDDISAVSMEDAIFQAGINLEAAYKFGPWGNTAGKFCVFHKEFSSVLSFPYADASKDTFMLNQGPWDGKGIDPRDMFRHQANVAFYHAAQDPNDSQTQLLGVQQLFSERNSMRHPYLNKDYSLNF